MNENEMDFTFVKCQLLLLLEAYEGKLGQETVDAVRHFIDHDEYEMAYEGLFIDLMNIAFDPNEISVDIYRKIGEDLNLKEESVFEEGFWEKFEGYLDKWTAR
ncbi:hypothetical protein [Burkholderia ambifaria]|uniref:hypothetical protein n=1 Tax=Burkholderia ambifaria TaxID=152480 RepID=UPI00158BE1EF|nr:hypothetical protein [Burkholderia ambifaria]WDR87345.1 hypothetical protein OR986_01605 [Burkholderia ambifaria]WDS00042.1 hypothetical protein OR985_06555 [Burkholderia ambifaria]